ncbi:MAG: MBL fold metallo-hydrolase [Candidatus Bathyarchaeota archaeon]|nr:MAG: MBL fold metallo-hydrolase [Candidatus Bathyarchaeota archaeon]
MKASVTRKGAVLLGKYVACDAHEDSRSLRIVTHAHADHMGGLHQSLRNCEIVVMTAATRDLINVMKGSRFLKRGNSQVVEYNKTMCFKDEQITLYKVGHILGSAQVLVEDIEGTRILYTGDFRIADTPVIQSDILVIEATYGSPWRTRNFANEAESRLVSLVEEGLEQGPVYVFGYHGKLQEVMQILHEARIRTPFVMPERILQITRVHQKHGRRIHRPLFLTKHELQSTLQEETPFVAFYHMSWRRKIDPNNLQVCVSGWEFNVPCRQIGEREYVVALSDHSDFKGLLEYVRQSKPELVITDNYRAGDAYTLAKQIRTELGIEARPLPT